MDKLVETEIGYLPEHWTISTVKEESLFVTDYLANGSFASLKENVTYKSNPDFAILVRLLDFSRNFSGDFVYIDEHAYNFLGKSKLLGGEIIVSNVGEYAGTVFRAPNLGSPMTLGPNAVMLNFKSGNDFYYYWFKSPNGQSILQSIRSGSAVPKFNKTDFRNSKIPVPPIDEQHQIATILRSLDEKIDLLNRQNKTLEQLAETLFRQWFVEEADESWKEVSLGEFISVKHGYAFKGNHISTQPTNLILVTPGNFRIGGGFKFDKFKYYTKEDFPKHYIFKTDDLVVTMTDLSVQGDTLGYPALIPENCSNEVYLHNQRVGKVEIKKELGKFFIYNLMKTLDYQWFVLGSASGTSIRHTSPSSICAYTFKMPPKEVRLEFENFANSTEEKRKKNQTQIYALTKLRDTLLPKLMSGEVRVEN